MFYVYAINNKIFSLIRYFTFDALSYIWTKTFSFGRHVLFGGHLRLESSLIQVNMKEIGDFELELEILPELILPLGGKRKARLFQSHSWPRVPEELTFYE